MPSGGKASQPRASTTALALFFLKTHCGCEQGCDSTAASSAMVNCTALRTPSCASFDRTRESIMAEWAEQRLELDDTRAELCRLRELHARARNEREEIARLRAFANFACPPARARSAAQLRPISRALLSHRDALAARS
jgi:hypothetical protein